MIRNWRKTINEEHGSLTANSWTRDNAVTNNFLSNGGTELNPTTNLFDLDFRNFDPILGRMNGVDMMASKYSSVSPYHYSFNNPVSFNDPSGADPVYVSNSLYNFVMAVFNMSNSRPVDSYSNYSVASGGVGGGSSFGGGGGGGSSGGDWGSQYNGSGTWTRGSGWTYETNQQSLERAITYNNQFSSWNNTALASGGSVQSNGGGTFLFGDNGTTYGAYYQTTNGQVTHLVVGAASQCRNGAWAWTGDGNVIDYEAKGSSSGSGFWSALWNSPIARYFVPDYFVFDIGSSGGAGAVGEATLNFTLILRGKDPGLYKSQTGGINGSSGAGVDVLAKIGYGYFITLNPAHASSDILEGPQISGDIGIEIKPGLGIGLGGGADFGYNSAGINSITVSGYVSAGMGIATPILGSLGYAQTSTPVPIFKF